MKSFDILRPERVTAQQVGNGGQIGRAEKRRSNPTPAWAGRCDYGMASISSGGAFYLMNSLG